MVMTSVSYGMINCKTIERSGKLSSILSGDIVFFFPSFFLSFLFFFFFSPLFSWIATYYKIFYIFLLISQYAKGSCIAAWEMDMIDDAEAETQFIPEAKAVRQ